MDNIVLNQKLFFDKYIKVKKNVVEIVLFMIMIIILDSVQNHFHIIYYYVFQFVRMELKI